MRRHHNGQSMVEMALLLPFLLLVVFGIIELGYYVYGYASIYQAARNGAEKAAEIPPYPSQLTNPNDICTKSILDATKAVDGQFTDLRNTITISYPQGRGLSKPIEISIVYQLRPLTPLWNFVTFGTQGTMTIRTTARRSIEALGNNPTAVNLVACQPGPGGN